MDPCTARWKTQVVTVLVIVAFMVIWKNPEQYPFARLLARLVVRIVPLVVALTVSLVS